jgi:broad specificity phosphatase PhoE
MPLTIYFLRHGQTKFSRENAFCGSGLNPELTEAGSEMAESFAEVYQRTAWQAVYSSPLKRALLTAEPLCKKLSISAKPCEDLKEIAYGKWEGMSVEEVSEKYHDDYIKWTADPAWNAPTGGELAIMIARRSLKAIEEIKQKYSDGNVLVVSHKATIRIILCSLLGIDVGRFRFRFACPVSSVSSVKFSAQGPLLEALADRRHLSQKLLDLPGT